MTRLSPPLERETRKFVLAAVEKNDEAQPRKLVVRLSTRGRCELAAWCAVNWTMPGVQQPTTVVDVKTPGTYHSAHSLFQVRGSPPLERICEQLIKLQSQPCLTPSTSTLPRPRVHRRPSCTRSSTRPQSRAVTVRYSGTTSNTTKAAKLKLSKSTNVRRSPNHAAQTRTTQTSTTPLWQKRRALITLRRWVATSSWKGTP